jgi:hypothetical protein
MENKYNGYTNYITWKVAHELIDPHTFEDLEEGPEADDIRSYLIEELAKEITRIKLYDQGLGEVVSELLAIGLSKINFEELKEVYTL